ncbi:methionyl-tRNA formyltransferase [Patescibacteria group bacterium]
MIKLKIIFIGTGDFAASILETIIKQLNIDFIITGQDKPVGRKKEITFNPVKKTALKYNLNIIQPKKISDVKLQISKYNPDLIITADYGQIIPLDIINAPKFKTINIHPSLLPKYRGPAPIQAPIINGDKITGVTIMLIDEKVDHGPIISQIKISIAPKDTALTLRKKLSKEAGLFLIKILPKYIEGKIIPKKQDESQASYTKIMAKQDGRIDFTKENAQIIERKIKAFYPWPGTWTILNKKRIKIIKAKIAEKYDSKNMIVKTKNGYLELEIVQPEGKKPMAGKEFLKGNKML